MSLFAELKRRNVLRVAAAYAVLSWLVLQIADTLGDTFALPEWTGKFIVLLLIIGILPTLIFSWVYELTPEGVKKESEIAQSDSITSHTGKRLDLVVIIMLAIAIGLFGLDRYTDHGVRAEFPGSDPISAGNSALTPSAEFDWCNVIS